MMRFGVGMSFGLSYYATAELFDTNIKSRAFAICNILARILTIAAPLTTELISHPIIIVLIISLLSGVISQLIIQKENTNESQEKLIK